MKITFIRTSFGIGSTINIKDRGIIDKKRDHHYEKMQE